VAAAAIVLSSAAPTEEPSWPVALVPAPAAPVSVRATPRSATPSVTGPATPVLIPSVSVATRISGA
jgi:hypothetical protein